MSLITSCHHTKDSKEKTISSRTAIAAVEYALQHLSEREAGFSQQELLITAMQQTLGKITPQQLKQAIAAVEQAGTLSRRWERKIGITLDHNGCC